MVYRAQLIGGLDSGTVAVKTLKGENERIIIINFFVDKSSSCAHFRVHK